MSLPPGSDLATVLRNERGVYCRSVPGHFRSWETPDVPLYIACIKEFLETEDARYEDGRFFVGDVEVPVSPQPTHSSWQPTYQQLIRMYVPEAFE
jgi:hypothetical protein